MRRETRGLFALVLLLTLGALAYGVAYLWRAAASDTKIHIARSAVLRDTIPLCGVVIREECVLYADSPYILLAAEEGGRVGQGDLLALACAREEALSSAAAVLAERRAGRLLRPLRSESGRIGSPADLEAAAELITRESAAALARGELTAASAALRPLGNFLRTEETDFSAAPDYDGVFPVYAAQSGLFSEKTDSLESLTPESLTAPGELRRLFEQQPAEPVSGALGRLCTGSTWYFAALVSTGELARIAPGDAITLALPGITVQGCVCSLTPGAEESAVLFSAREGLSAVLSLRYAEGEAVLSELSGLLVPEEAVFSEGEDCFVYRAAGRIAKKTAVTILRREGNSVLLSAPSLRDGAALLSGRGLSDGKLVSLRR